MINPIENCPACEDVAEPQRAHRAVPFGSRQVEVEDEWMKCASCGEEYYTSEQAEQLQRRTIQQMRLEDGLLPPAEIKAIRVALGLSQRDFERLLGTGEKTCVRWEAGRVCQSAAADRLIRLVAANRDNVRILAAISGVSLSDFALIPRPRLVPIEHHDRGLALPPQFPELAPASVSVGGSREPCKSLTHTDEHAVIEGALLSVTNPVSAGEYHGH